MIKAGIIGATGYAGVELVRILLKHSEVEKLFLSSVSFEGKNITEVYPNLIGQLAGKTDGLLINADKVLEASDVVFAALPNGLAEPYALYCEEHGKKFVDLSADFRFGNDEDTYVEYYKKNWEHKELHEKAVYGLPEMNRDKIKGASIIGNPGCYVTASTLAILPALKADIAETSLIIVDAKSGVTGAGRNPTMTNQFCECGESFSAYKVGSHRHQPEIARNCREFSGKETGIIFTPHLIPQNRGILSTVYIPLKKAMTTAEIHKIYADFYASEHFVRVLPEGTAATTRSVRYTNYCDIQVYAVNGGKTLEVVSVIDNMVKGSAGQAVQNMNLMCGFAETEGIDFVPTAF
jgi:N-acetyl-gamma-glutamyl-phosphate reductase